MESTDSKTSHSCLRCHQALQLPNLLCNPCSVDSCNEAFDLLHKNFRPHGYTHNLGWISGRRCNVFFDLLLPKNLPSELTSRLRESIRSTIDSYVSELQPPKEESPSTGTSYEEGLSEVGQAMARQKNSDSSNKFSLKIPSPCITDSTMSSPSEPTDSPAETLILTLSSLTQSSLQSCRTIWGLLRQWNSLPPDGKQNSELREILRELLFLQSENLETYGCTMRRIATLLSSSDTDSKNT